jgi:hypothetical protein
MTRIPGWMLWGCLVVMVWAGLAQGKEEIGAAPVIEVEVPTYHFDQVSEGEVVKHDFRVFNRGASPLEIKRVKPG